MKSLPLRGFSGVVLLRAVVACGLRGSCALFILLAALSVARASAGDYDTSFGNGGIFSFPTPNATGIARDLVQTSDGSLLVAGSQNFGAIPVELASTGPLLVKVTPTGRIDATFGTNGFDNVRRGTKALQDAMLIAAAPPNQFTVVETHGNPCLGTPPHCAEQVFRDVFARRINGNGAPDPTYGSGGATLVPLSEGSLAVSPAGALAVVTMFAPLVNDVFRVAALTPGGVRDPTFEQNALAALNCGSQFAPAQSPVGVTRWSGGKLLVAMSVMEAFPDPDRTLCVSRLNEDGSLDPSFATNGHFVFQTASLVNHFPFKILARSDGRILIVMLDGAPGSIHTPALLWLTPNGGLDTAFVSGGVVNPANLLVASVADVGLQADDKVLVAGYNSAASGTPTLPLDAMHPILARFAANGSALDMTFDAAHLGFRTLTNGAGWLSPQKVLASADGGIFVVGTLVSSMPPPADSILSGDFAVAKLRDVPDTGGGGGGCAMVQAAGSGPIDPTLPSLLVLALMWACSPEIRRQRRRAATIRADDASGATASAALAPHACKWSSW